MLSGLFACTLLVGRVGICSHQMDRDVGLVSYDPTVVAGFNVEQVSGLHLEDAAIVHGGGGAAFNHDANMLHFATGLAQGAANMDGPPPARLVGGAANRHSAN